MDVNTFLQVLYDLYDRVVIVLARPVVQRQLVGFAIVFMLAWLLPFLLQQIVRRWSAHTGLHVDDAPPSWRRRMLRLARGVESTFFPLLGLIFSQLAVEIFDYYDWRSGLLKNLRPIFWLLLIYRILVGIFLTLMDEHRAKQYTRRFLLPLFLLITVIFVNKNLGGTFPLDEIQLMTIMGKPLTLKMVFSAVVVLYFFLIFAWIIRDLLNEVVLERTNTDTGVANAVVLTSYYSIIALGILTSVSTLGFDLSTLTIVLGGLSVGISFGLQELVANFISGILLVFEQSLRPGDVIRVSGFSGTVAKLRLRSTVLRTLDNVEIFVPNKTLLTSTVETFTHTNRMVRQTVGVGVSYDSKPEDVRDILLDVAARHGLVLKDPPPSVLFQNFGDSSLDFALLFWIADPPRAMQIGSDLRFMIFRDFERRGIVIPFPQRDLHVRSGMPSAQPIAEITGSELIQ